MSYQYPPPYPPQDQQQPYWSPQGPPPAPPPRSGGGAVRTFFGTLLALLMTPVGIGLIASGAGDSSRWEAVRNADRVGSNLQIAAGAFVLLLVAALAAYAPASAVLSGLAWGLVPGALALIFPGDTLRFIRDLPVLSLDTKLAVGTWAINGNVLLTGALLIGAGLAAAMRRR